MQGQFSSKVALITGAGSGVGRSVALQFAACGAQLALSDVNEQAVQETAELVRQAGAKAIACRTDVTSEEQVAAFVDGAVKAYGAVHCAVNSAGIEGARAKTDQYEMAEWTKVIGINLTGVWLSMKYEIRAMKAAGGGAIVNMGSTASTGGVPRMMAYTASKHGVLGLTRAASLEVAKDKIRVNAVCPGSFWTPMSDRLFGGEEGKARVAANTPMGRVADVDEISQSIIWLCSDAASFITGIALPVSGGRGVST